MPQYLFTATSRDGAKVTDRVGAATVEGARYALETRGFTEIVFHTDDSSHRIDAAMSAEMGTTDADYELSPEQEKEARQGGGMLSGLWFAWKVNALFWVPTGAWAAWAWWNGRPYSFWDWTAFGVFGLFLVYFVWLVIPGVGYQGLLAASLWNRLAQTRSWVAFLRFTGRFSPVKIPKLELDMRLAWVLARNDRAEEARRLLADHESNAAGDAMILMRLSGIYDALGEHDRAHATRTKGVEVSGGGLGEIVDHAFGLIRQLRRPAEARASIDRVADREQSDLVKVFVCYTEALIALEEGRIEVAEKGLEDTESALAPYANNEIMKGMVREIWMYKAIALAMLQRTDEARKLFRAARPLLTARRETALIERCAALLAGGK